ncbi:MAG: DUF4177 domain-containing protein [Xanthomonadales bacterium]|nr:DUF4177 domain-containing protein [Xanthomonadales bacterium]
MTATRRWEYRTLRIKTKIFGDYDPADIDADLDRLGAQGWELVGSAVVGVSFLMFLKREK